MINKLLLTKTNIIDINDHQYNIHINDKINK